MRRALVVVVGGGRVVEVEAREGVEVLGLVRDG